MLRRLPLLLLLATGCATEPHDDGHGEVYDDHLHEEGGEVDLKASGLSTVNDVIRGRGCSTAPLRALDEQIATELACLAPDTMKRIDTIPGLSLGGGARTFLQADTADALRKVAGRVGHISINSGWRSVAQQHVLKSWEGSCGIGVAASPGQSNHQSGIALDIDNWDSAAMRSALRAEGFSWYCDYRNGGRASGCNDAVHFDFFSGDDLRPLAVLAMVEKTSLPPGVVPTRRLYDSPAAGVCVSVGAVHESVRDVSDAAATVKWVGAVGAVFVVAALFR